MVAEEVSKILTFNFVIFQLENVSCYQNFQAIVKPRMSLYCTFDFSYTLAGSLSRPILVISIFRQSPQLLPLRRNFQPRGTLRYPNFRADLRTLFCQSNGKRRDGIIISLPSKKQPIPFIFAPSRRWFRSYLVSSKRFPDARINFSSASKRHGCSLESSVLFFLVASLAKRRFASSGRRKGKRGWDYVMIAL